MPRAICFLCFVAAVSSAADAHAATGTERLVISGAGNGHGVGMSQFGAYGFARRGRRYPAILRHYYSGTRLGTTSPNRVVRVILQANQGAVRFSGATAAAGRGLDRRVSYRAVRRGADRVELQTSKGRPLANFRAPLRVSGPAAVRLHGGALNGVSDGRYRGALELRPGRHGGLNAVNALALDQYVRGVVPGEVPPTWPVEAVRAQAVAARTYAITTDAGGAGFDQWPDTRSQVYRGVAGEHPAADAAIRATRGVVVTYGGRPVVTYFFSTSGGRTESVELSVLGPTPRPWLRSVPDPYDHHSPLHRWTIRLSLAEAKRRLGDLLKGRLYAIRVTRRGVSPRVVSARVKGSRGSSKIRGDTLMSALGGYSSWVRIKR